MAITSQISLEVAVIPFLWMLPLSLYLLSFVLCFEYERVYHRGLWVALLLLGAGATAVIIRVGVDAPMLLQLAVYLLTLFFACMVCHGELVRHKPDPRHLTGFYLLVSAGGAAGGEAEVAQPEVEGEVQVQADRDAPEGADAEAEAGDGAEAGNDNVS